MPASPLPAALKVESIFLPSDFSEVSEVAFAHALKFALLSGATLNILHVTAGAAADWQDFPGVRDTLERWGLVPPGSPKSAVGDLGLKIRKVMAEGRDPVRACLQFLETHPAELIVLAVGRHEGRMRWLGKAVGEPVARAAGQMTLFVPQGVEGFVARATGAVSLRNILVPITTKPRPQPAVEAVVRLIRHLELKAGTVTLLHAGAAGEAPAVQTPELPGWTWHRATAPGQPVPVILQHAATLPADLIVMTTDGPDGFLDGLRGTTSERVLHAAPCPVAILPVGSLLG